jgi:hypothetical protein
MLNLVLPGAGQFYLGQRLLGCAFAAGFLACLAAMLVIFVAGLTHYWDLATRQDMPDELRLQQMRQAMHTGQLLILLGVGVLLYVLSLAVLRLVPPPCARESAPATDRGAPGHR